MKHDLNKMGRVTAVFGGQWGSEGKGAVVSWLAEHARHPFNFAITNAGAQAGHTTVREDGSKFICFHLPTSSALTNTPAYVSAGAIIEPEVLMRELDYFPGLKDKLFIHPRAAIISPKNTADEHLRSAAQTKSGSTQKGVGAALAAKVQREATLAADNPWTHPYTLEGWFGPDRPTKRLDRTERGILEIPQGFDLSLNHGLAYPHCTSRDCTPMAAMSDAGLAPGYLGHVVMIVRTYPIRVGHITSAPNGQGELIGYSGPCHYDQNEIAFEHIGVPPEFTTVTGRKRRIFTFSAIQYARALEVTHPTDVVVTFCNYLRYPEEFKSLLIKMDDAEHAASVFPKRYYQYGPKPSQVLDLDATGFGPAMEVFHAARREQGLEK